MFFIDLYSKSLKYYSCLKPLGLEAKYFYVALSSGPILNLLKLMALGSKEAPTLGVTRGIMATGQFPLYTYIIRSLNKIKKVT